MKSLEVSHPSQNLKHVAKFLFRNLSRFFFKKGDILDTRANKLPFRQVFPS